MQRTISKLKERQTETEPERDLRTEKRLANKINRQLRSHKIDIATVEAEGMSTVELKDEWKKLKRKSQPYAVNPYSSLPNLVTPQPPRQLLGLVLGATIVEPRDLDKVDSEAWYIIGQGFDRELLLIPISGFKNIRLTSYRARFLDIPWPHF